VTEISFRPGLRENVGLFIGLAGETSGGKTMSAMKLATGIVGRQNKFCVIDTENKRASHYAPLPGAEPDFINTFRFDVFDFEPPFNPARYEEIVSKAVAAGYKTIVLDSGSHEHDGYGGYLDMQAEDLDKRVTRYMEKWPNSKEYDVIEKLTPSSWIVPKRERRRMRETLLRCSTSIPIIFCFRAEEKVFSSKDGKLVANNPPIWSPICGKGMPNEMTVFFLLHAARPGVPVPIKLQDQHRGLFPLDKPLAEESGKRIAEWAKGGTVKDSTSGSSAQTSSGVAGAAASNPDPLFVKAREIAEGGTERYQKWFLALSREERTHLGTERHETFKALAAKVPT